VDGRVVGVVHTLRDGRAVRFYIGGHDPDAAFLSPGGALVRHAIEGAIAAGVPEFDFLRGEEPYKYQWGAAARQAWRVRVER
jgi:CelD/BcsL family acetyltransferase involved in cellulose biosynthesis